ERPTADEMDERRRQQVAYQYLCHLEEAKRWMESCLREELDPPMELEESLRNGVILAKLGHCFAPELVPLKKIYDREQLRYKASGLHFRHTDNINHWRDAMSHVGLPLIFHPETTDVYDKKNMPRVVYCIHALSLYLFKLGLAPQIQDLYGKVDFTEEEINNMKRELEKYGLQLPSFSKIGGLLANELSVDEAAVHAAVLAINEALERGVAEQTMEALRNPSAMLLNLREPAAAAYHELLLQAKLEKAGNARNRVSDIYDRCLTQAEIQGNINKVNGEQSCSSSSGGRSLVDGGTCAGVAPGMALIVVPQLEKALCPSRDAPQGCGLSVRSFEPWPRGTWCPLQELGYGPSPAHRLHSLCSVLQAVSRINAAVRRGMPAETLAALAAPTAQLPTVHPLAAPLYQHELALLQRQHPRGELAQEELFVAVEMLSAVALVNQALEARDSDRLWSSLVSPALGLSDVEDANAQRYFDDLLQLKGQVRKAGHEFLSWNDIQATVSGTNSSVQKENGQVLAVELINEALLQGDPEKTLAALLLPAASLAGITPVAARRYQHVLSRARQRKARATGDDRAALWWDEIQRGVCEANEDSAATRRMALGVAAINQAIKEGKAAQTARVLLNPAVALRGLLPACARAYQQQLSALAATKAPAGSGKPCWVRHKLADGTEYFLSLETLEGTWEWPLQGGLCTTHLSREEIQSVVTRVTAAHDRERLWEANTGLVMQLQARARGFLVRRAFATRCHVLREQWPAATKIQAFWRGRRQRRAYLARLRYLRANADAVVKIQACVRMWQARKKFQERLRYFRRNVSVGTAGNPLKQPWELLVGVQNPEIPPEFWIFFSYGQGTSQSWEKPQEAMREHLAGCLADFPALLVCCRDAMGSLSSSFPFSPPCLSWQIKAVIKIQAFVRANKARGDYRMLAGDLPAPLLPAAGEGCRALVRPWSCSTRLLSSYSSSLQTQPGYLARLIFQMPQNKSTKFMESVIFTLYNYASNPREAYLLLQLFKAALQEEIRSKVDHIHDILTGNPTVIRLVVSFYRNARGQNSLRQILGAAVQEVLQDKTLSIRTNPVDIYKAWINQMESQSGQKSKLPYEVSPEQALSHPEVQRRLDISIRSLLVMTDKFVSAITSSVDKIPYGMRYVAKILKTSLAEKFPEASEEEISKIVGNLLYYRFMNPAVVAPDGFDIVDISAGVALHPDHRRNLGSIAKVLQHAAARKAFDGESAHLRVVNRYLEDTHEKFRWFISAACCVPEPEERFNMDEYSEMVAVAKPVIYITVGELINTHKLLLEHQDSIAPLPGDPLHELLEDLDEVPTVQVLVGEGAPNPADGPAEQGLSQLAKAEISLTLANKLVLEASSEEADVKSLLLSTKQMLVDVIQSQTGDSLLEILQTPASEDEEASHSHLMHRRLLRDAQTPEKLKRNHSLPGNSQLSVEEKKRKVIRNLRRLESLGLVDSVDGYQGLVNEMAKDIRNQRRYRQHRKGELLKLRQTLQGLDSKTLFYEEQIDYYNQYIKTCLDNLAASNKGVFLCDDQVCGPISCRTSGKNKKLQPLHYTAAQLFEKGVLLEIEDLPLSQFRNVIFDIIPCEESGKFQVKAKFMGIDMEKFQLHYQDLLQLQYEGVAVMKMFDKAKVNVNLLIFLLNKKFFKK
ncbi:IQGA1 protein, partial [Nothocercus nigrocapillus]|nr:IQGA1 protein [Nothocercus nigrocapillus]